MAKYRTDRINEEYRNALSQVLRELKDPRVPMMTSVVSVSVTADQKYAKAGISVMGSKEEVAAAVAALNKAAGFIRREVSSKINMRSSPELSFVADGSIEYGAHISKILGRLEVGDDEK